MRLVVGHELDEQLPAAGDDGRRRDLPAELPQHGGALVAAVVHLHVVVPAGEEKRGGDDGGATGAGSRWAHAAEPFPGGLLNSPSPPGRTQMPSARLSNRCV